MWKEAHTHLKADQEVIVSSPVRFPSGYEHLLQYLCSGSHFMAQACYRKLRQQRIQIAGEHRDCNEHFIMWKCGQSTGMIRITISQLKVEMQQKIDSLIRTIGEP